MEPFVDPNRPDWEIPFADVHNRVLSVMPGESNKTFFDPMIGREVRWEQDVYCPTGTVYDGRIYCVYRAYGDDDQWRMGLAWSDDGIHFERGPTSRSFTPSRTTLSWARCATARPAVSPLATPG